MPTSTATEHRRRAVVAIGGNAITAESEQGTYQEMLANCQALARPCALMVAAGWQLILVHGNGPQVGNLELQQMASYPNTPEQPLHALDAMTQGLVGHLLHRGLSPGAVAADSPITTILTHVMVQHEDPAFDNPTKPIGPFYGREQADRLREQHGWSMVDDAQRGWRRIVPSPRPRHIVELSAIKGLVDAGFTVICGGGGGIPVTSSEKMTGVEAVIDKDRTAALLASSLGADALVLVTAVESVVLNFGTPQARALHDVSSAEMTRFHQDGHFPAGSMGPKVESAIDFAEASEGTATITSTAGLPQALEAGATVGTRISRPKEAS
ncbi:MAG: carbamate kinase [Actinomycetia bacterium]|nr:carbamate kinase [Actinomycetes bacterium]